MRIWLAGLWLMLLAVAATPPALAAPNYRNSITSEAEFAKLSKAIDGGRYASFPRVMFVIDREGRKGPKLYLVNTQRYAFHIDFIQKNYLSTLTVEELDRVSYAAPNRRFILGSVVHYPQLKRYGVEFWEGDVLNPVLLGTAMTMLQAAFPRPLAFKANSNQQADVARGMPGLAQIDGNSIYGSRDMLTLNPGRAVGRLRILPRITDEVVIARGDILILDESPLRLSPVAGVITTEFSTPLSHVNLLAKSWRIPNGYVKNAASLYRELNGQWVRLDARPEGMTIRAATLAEIAKANRARGIQAVQIAKADVSFRGLPSLLEQRRSDVIRTGAKAANLGDVARRIAIAKMPDFVVPKGFSIPFAYYADFVRANGLDRRIDALLADPQLMADAVLRRAALAKLRTDFVAAPIDPALLAAVSKRRAEVLGTAGVFARSSTNSEDLKGFNGAGLYTSVPNVLTEADLSRAIRTVWASVWNDAAFDARVAAGIDHKSVMAAVLVQTGMNAQASGVMITENPFDPMDKGAVFINAKRGLGMRVVEGRRVAEQLIYRPQPESIQVLTRSTDDAMLIFDANGGVVERPVEPGHAVLTDPLARRLARVARQIAAMFGGKPQDIEWLVIGDQIFIVQSRPYLRGV
jgi:hypothetical protein